MRGLLVAAALVAAVPAAARAQDGGEPRFCPNRPSIGESGCVTEPHHVQFEVSAIDWTLERGDGERQDTILAGDFQARIGMTPRAELQVAWTPYGHVRTRDALGAVSTASAVGDVQIGWRQNLRAPDGKGLSFAVEPSVTVPVGRAPIGDGTWSAGVVVPVTYDLSDALNLALTNEAAAQANEDGQGRHLRVNEVVGLGYQLDDAVTAVGEFQYVHDADPGDRHDELTAAASLAWQPRHGLQLDVIVARGLDADAPAWRVATGGALLF